MEMFDARIEDTMTTITIVTEEVEEAFEETEAVATGYFFIHNIDPFSRL